MVYAKQMARRPAPLYAEQPQRLRLQPASPAENCDKIVGTGQHRRERDPKHRLQRILPALTPAPVLNFAERIP